MFDWDSLKIKMFSFNKFEVIVCKDTIILAQQEMSSLHTIFEEGHKDIFDQYLYYRPLKIIYYNQTILSVKVWAPNFSHSNTLHKLKANTLITAYLCTQNTWEAWYVVVIVLV